jgi:hypothetical protein
MTRLISLIIQGNYPNNIYIDSAKQENGKCRGFLYLLRDGQIHSLLLTSDSIFESDEKAKDKLHEICKSLKTPQ